MAERDTLNPQEAVVKIATYTPNFLRTREYAVRNFIVLGLIVFILPACGSIPVMSMLKLSRLDPLTADGAQIRVAVRLPDTLDIQPDGAVLVLRAQRASLDEQLEGVFVLEQDPEPGIQAGLESEAKPGFHITIFRIPTQDTDKLASLQRQIIAWKQQDPDGTKGSLSVSVAGCRVGPTPQGELLVSTYLRTEDESDFITLTRDVDLLSFEVNNGQEQDSYTNLPLCDSAA